MITTVFGGTAVTTIGTSPYLRTYYERALLAELFPNLVFRKDAVPPVNVPAGQPSHITWRRPRKLTVNQASDFRLNEGVTPAPMTRTIDRVTAQIYQYGGWMGTTDLTVATAYDPIVSLNQKALGFFSAEVMDSNVRDELLTGVTNVIYAAGRTARSSVAAGDVIDDALLKKAAAFLTNQSVPKFSDGRYHAIMPSLGAYDMMGTDGWKQPAYYQNRMDIESGNVRDLYGIRPMFTQIMTKISGAGSGGIDVYRAYVFGQGAFGTAGLSTLGLTNTMVPANQPSAADPLGQRGSQGCKWTDAAKTLDVRCIVAIEFALGYAG